MALSPALVSMNMGLGDQLAQQAQETTAAMKKKKLGTYGSPMANGGPGSASLSPAAQMLFGMSK